MNGNGCDGSIAWGVRTGQDLLSELPGEPLPLGFRQILLDDHLERLLGQRFAQQDPFRLLGNDQRIGPLGDRVELLGRGHPVGTEVVDPLQLVTLQPRHPDHEEFVEIVPEIDRKRSRSSSGWAGLDASSSTRRLKASQLSSLVEQRAGPAPRPCPPGRSCHAPVRVDDPALAQRPADRRQGQARTLGDGKVSIGSTTALGHPVDAFDCARRRTRGHRRESEASVGEQQSNQRSGTARRRAARSERSA